MALFLVFSVQNLVNRELKVEIVNGLIGPQGSGIEWMLGDIPSVTAKREKLERSIKLLKESVDIVAEVMDWIATNAG